MSLDIYLEVEGLVQEQDSERNIPIRENGQTVLITKEEAKEKFPNNWQELTSMEISESAYVFDYNITHNLGKMAREAEIYEHLWRPEEIEIETAKDLIRPLSEGYTKLLENPNRFKKFNPENGWGKYEDLVKFVKEYLKACLEYPEAKIRVSR